MTRAREHRSNRSRPRGRAEHGPPRSHPFPGRRGGRGRLHPGGRPQVNPVTAAQGDREAQLERAAAGRLSRPVHGDPRRLDRERRAAVDQGCARLLHHRPAVGPQRLHPDLRRLPAARRARRRPLRPPPDVLPRHPPLLRRLPPVRGRAHRRRPGRRTRPAGNRRGDPLPRHPGDHHHLVRRGRAAQPRARSLGRGRRDRRHLGCAARRHPHRGVQLARDLRHQRPDRPRDRALQQPPRCRRAAARSRTATSTFPAPSSSPSG